MPYQFVCARCGLVRLGDKRQVLCIEAPDRQACNVISNLRAALVQAKEALVLVPGALTGVTYPASNTTAILQLLDSTNDALAAAERALGTGGG